MAKNGEKILDALTFLFPLRLSRKKHFKRKDVREIKNNLTTVFSYVYLIISIILILLSSSLTIFMFISTNGNYTERYGNASLAGQIALMSGSFVNIVLFIISKITKNFRIFKKNSPE